MEKYDDYGVPRDVFAAFKWYFLYVPDLIILFLTGFVIMLANGKFPKSEWLNMGIFDLATITLGIFLILHANGGRRNYNIIILYLQKKAARYKKFYRAMDNTEEIKIDANY